MSGPGAGAVRVVRGAPRDEELAALLAVLTALAGTTGPPHGTPAPPAPWTRDSLPRQATSPLAHRLPTWRAR
ncbi:acyl-CoA carboxylase subunit epsilon [Streptomyces triticagri]|uniref:Acyl-CoA carboxylase subunit epsilon n=1 Tax=Streptomyces triticagri TaxID=2293568 RepID=A0A372M4J1_9ACTN|nr:acyl-CoA carboxylase epsilon subunit [Streptomyces triticagri]RFU85719.1 acyl-CoA carboxylase subunit epsilon [Streptomyces triticagri]